MRPVKLYHVTSHAVAGTWLFETARDRVIFLSLLAWQCRERGLVVHGVASAVRIGTSPYL